MESQNLYRAHAFKSKIFPELYFVAAKPYLVGCLIIYLSSIFFVDYFADSIAFYTENVLRSLATPQDGIFQLKRIFLEDIVFDFGFCVIFLGMLFSSPRWFFCFYGHQKFDEESLWMSFFRVFTSCFASSVALIMFLAFIQGCFFWIPRLFSELYLEYVLNITVFKKGYREAQYIAHFGWLKPINLSLIFIFFVRIGIITTILQGLLIRDKRFKLVHPLIIIASLIPLLLFAARYVEPQQYQAPLAEKSSTPKYLKDKEKISNFKPTQELITEHPKASISIYDPNTKETVSNN